LQKHLIMALIAIILGSLLMIAYSTVEASLEIDAEKIDTFISEEMSTSRVPGLALGIVENGEIVYLQGYGYVGRDRETTPQTPFMIGSVSKSFTAVAAMQLHEEGKLNLDAPVKEYLPWFEMDGNFDVSEMTVHHLLVQTSGIPMTAGYTQIAESSTLALGEEVRALKEVALVHSPGDAYIYSNANFIILSLIIEEVTETGYTGHVQDEIFNPLGMDNSFLNREDGEENGLSDGHIKWFGIPRATDVQYLENSLAAGFIIASAEDMSRYILMHLGEGSYQGATLLSQDGVAELHRPGQVRQGTTEYAMGLVAREQDDQTLIMHDGMIQGFNSGMVFSPEKQWGVIVLTNMSSQLEMPAMNIALGVADILQDKTPGSNARTWSMVYLGGLFLFLILIIMNLRSLILLPSRWLIRIKDNYPRGFIPILGRLVLPVGLELIFPYLVFIMIPSGAGFPVWNLFALFHPDLVYMLLLLAALLLIKALLRIYLLFRIRSN